MMKNETTTAVQPPAGWRFRIGIIIFVVGFLSPLLIPVVAATGLPTTWKAAISGLLAVGIPEVFSLVAIAIVGKSGFNLFGWLAPYLSNLIPFFKTHCIAFGIVGDVLLVVSLFVLGGDFWDKIRSLFIHGAKAQIPDGRSG
jgi:hypothetical protein